MDEFLKCNIFNFSLIYLLNYKKQHHRLRIDLKVLQPNHHLILKPSLKHSCQIIFKDVLQL